MATPKVNYDEFMIKLKSIDVGEECDQFLFLQHLDADELELFNWKITATYSRYSETHKIEYEGVSRNILPSFNNHNIPKLKRAAYFAEPRKKAEDVNIKIDHGLEAAMQKAIGNIIDAKYAVVLEVVKMAVKPRQPNSEDFKRVTLLVHEKYTEVKFDGVSIGKIRAMYKMERSPISTPIQSGYEFTPNDEFKK